MSNIKLPDDIESLFGLWIIFELKKMPKNYQTRTLNKIKKGIYPKKNYG